MSPRATGALGAPLASPDPVHMSQAVFRTLLDAMARPGSIHELAVPSGVPGLLPTTAALLLALADHETPVWLDAPLAALPDLVQTLRFATGAAISDRPPAATFAVIAQASDLPPFDIFAQGTAEYPDRSTTLLIEVDALTSTGHGFEGPGIDGMTTFGFQPAPSDFAARLAANRALFPRGVDLIFCAPHAIAALPRSVRLKEQV